jgi:hypothetical protein
MGFPLEKTRSRLAEAAAQGLALVLSPRDVFRITGVVPFAESSSAPRVLRTWPEPAPFDAPMASEAAGRSGWVASRDRGAEGARLVMVEDGIALSTGAVLDSQGRLHPGASHDFDFMDRPGRSFRRFVPEPHRFLPPMPQLRQVVDLTASNQGFYFHWLFDVLPRLHLAEEGGFAEGPFFVEARRPFQRESLDRLGLLDRCLVAGPGRTSVSADRLVVPCHRIAPGRVVPGWVVDFLRERFLPNVDARPSCSRRIYVSRHRAGHRRVRNEPEVVDALAKLGFVSVELECMPFEDQIRLFRDAEVIVAPHGGGLANLAFSRPGTRVVELFPATNIDLYYRLARRLRLDYRYLKSEDGARSAMGPEDYRVDTKALATAVESAPDSARSRR